MKKVIFTFGRFNPPTHGHGKVFDYLFREASKTGADVWVYISPSHDAVKNPLTHAERAQAVKEAFPKAFIGSPTKLLTAAFDELIARGYTDITLFGGADRAASFDSLAKYYNKQGEGKLTIKIGEVPRPQGAISASIARDFALRGKLSEFLAALHPKLRAATGKKLYDIIRSRMTIKETRSPFSFSQFIVEVTKNTGQTEAPLSDEEQEKLDEPSSIVIDPPLDMPVSKLHTLPKDVQLSLGKDTD